MICPKLQFEIIYTPILNFSQVYRKHLSAFLRLVSNVNISNENSLTEQWNDQIMLHARVYDVSEQTVSCDCVVDEETQLIEKRTFPRLIFDTIPNLEEGSLVIVDIKQKAGSIRIDIKNGKGIIDPQKFELESLIDSLKDF